eukprot:1039885-Alexandrium_andersonii.AAC.1
MERGSIPKLAPLSRKNGLDTSAAERQLRRALRRIDHASNLSRHARNLPRELQVAIRQDLVSVGVE